MPNYREIAETLRNAARSQGSIDVMSVDDMLELAEFYDRKAKLLENGDLEDFLFLVD